MKAFTNFILFIALMGSIYTQAQSTVVDVVVNSDDHNTLEAAVLAADLASTLSGTGPFTVFAPTDSAFAALPAGLLDSLLSDTSQLKDILFYHVLGADVRSTDLVDGQTASTLLGKDVTVAISNDSVFINDALVTVADIVTDNGVVHVIDAVLVPPRVTVVDVVVNSEEHNTLEDAVSAANLVETLSGDGPFTVFAPTDDAFALLPEGTIDTLLADPSGALTDVLLYHVIGSEVRSTDLSDGQMATTLAGQDVIVSIRNDSVFINDALVTMADIITDNGVVHVIDAVLTPTSTTVVDVIVDSEDHTTLEAAVVAAGLVETLSGDGPFTIFAPTDGAFALLPEGTVDTLLADPAGNLTDILLYHVVSGQALSTDLADGQAITTLFGKDVLITISNDSVFINNALVTIADITTDNGVVHVIDAVLLPPARTTVVDVVVNSEIHSTLEAAVIAADLVETLNGDGPFTVFAPTDNAFALLPEGTVDTLLADPAGDLTDILLYHVVSGQALSTDLADGQAITTLFGKDVLITISNDSVFVNDALVTVADIATDNGVVHVIDAVLLPPARTTVVDVVVNSDIHNTLEAAVIAADLAETLSGEGPFTVFAPTDAAFAALPAGTVDTLLLDPSGQLTDILLYHVLGEDVRSTDLSEGQTATTLLSQDISISISNDTVLINDVAMVIAADIVTDNGVVHVIDAVLIPSTTTSTVYLDNSLVDVQVFPNPSSNELFINVLEPELEFNFVRVINMQGATVLEREILGNQHRLTLDRLVHGQYILQLANEQQVFHHKILVQP